MPNISTCRWGAELGNHTWLAFRVCVNVWVAPPPIWAPGPSGFGFGFLRACLCRGARWLRVWVRLSWSAFGSRMCVQGGVRLGLAPCGRRARRALDTGHPGTMRNCGAH